MEWNRVSLLNILIFLTIPSTQLMLLILEQPLMLTQKHWLISFLVIFMNWFYSKKHKTKPLINYHTEKNLKATLQKNIK